MRKNLIRLLIPLVILLTGCAGRGQSGSPAGDILPASAMHAFGRTAFSESGGLELISSASHIGFTFSGKECHIYASVSDPLGHNYLQYEIDGVYQKRIRIEGTARSPVTILASGNGVHKVWIYKATEAQTGPVFIHKITASHITAIEKAAAPLIEFIGNSITCGAAADPSEVPCGTGQYHDQHNAYMAYGPRVARALNANFLMSSVSGYGIYRDWNSDGPTLPMVYQKLRLAAGDNDQWDFKKYSPDIVSIALGTNDLSDGDGKQKRLPFDSTRFVNTYIQFAQLIKSTYPDAKILLLSSPMMGGAKRITLQNCITAVKMAVDKLFPDARPARVYFFNQMSPRGCSGHPSVEDHAILADELIPVYRQLMDE
ncbi:MAG: GDSL family lipase [Chitinophagaceae bacterium]|nr:MAG: GDSL family lipase [Chitinophagaceae bacterium]